jgi:hypothetical protein
VRTTPIDKVITQEYELLTKYYSDVKLLAKKTPYPLEFLKKSTEIDDSRRVETVPHYQNALPLAIDTGSYSEIVSEITITDTAICNNKDVETYLLEEKSFTIEFNKGQSQRSSQSSFQNIEGRPSAVSYTLSPVIF